MNINKLCNLVSSSLLTKMEIAERCGVSRTTIDNLLAGADVKISTVEAFAKVMNVPVGSLFDDTMNEVQHDNELTALRKKVEELTILNKSPKKLTKVVVEMELDSDEFVKLGLKDRVVNMLIK